MTPVLSTLSRADRHQLFRDIVRALRDCPVTVSMREDEDPGTTLVFALGRRLSALVLLRDGEDTIPPLIYWSGPGRLIANRGLPGWSGGENCREDATSPSLTFNKMVGRLTAGFSASRDGSSFAASTG